MSKLDQLRAQREALFKRVFKQEDFVDTLYDGPKSNKSNKSNSFDKKAYQREYMRARRAKKP